MIRNYKNPNNPSWSQATVKQKLGPRSYTCVYAHNNREIKRHIDQIRSQSDQSDMLANEGTSNVHQHNATTDNVIDVSSDDVGDESSVSSQTQPDGPNRDHDATRANSESIADEEDDLDRKGRRIRPQRNTKAVRLSRLPLMFD